MRIEKHETFIELLSKKNRFQIVIGKGAIYGIMGGIQLQERFDWWHLAFGFTFVCLFIKIEYRYRVANCGYSKGDIYIG